MIYNRIRQDIVNGEFINAFATLYSIISDPEKRDELYLIEFRVNELKKQRLAGLETNMVERNKTVYFLLGVVSELESNLNSNQREAMKALEMAKIEDTLARGYAKLADLQGESPVHAYLSWLGRMYPSSLKMLSANGRMEDDQITALLNVDLAGFMKQHKIDKPYDQVYKFLHYRLNSDPMFYASWNQQTELVQKTISNLERGYKTVLAGIGISFGGVLVGLFISDISDNDDDDDLETDDSDDD